MSGQSHPPFVRDATSQRGQAALIAVLLVLGAAAAAIVYLMATPAAISIANDKKTAAALSRAKEALIGYAAENSSKPGILPCPDTDNDGSSNSPCGVSGTTAIGRLPWKTLGLPDLRDGTGECLWYAVSANFKNSGASAPAIVNSNSVGTLAVNDISGNAVYGGSNSALAIVIAPGSALSGQDRSPASTTVCGGNTTVASYLEGGNQNGATTNTFIAGESNNSFNDKLLPVTRDALFPVVEARVVRELRSSLVNYYAANRFYPYSASFPNNVSTAATYRGYVPTTTSSCLPGSPDLLSYLPGYSASPPGWFVSNEWHKVIVYAVAPRCTPRMTTNLLWLGTASACAVGGCLGPIFGLYACLVPVALDPSANNCNNSGSYLTVSGATNVQSIVFAASYGFGGQSRPCNSITDCLETVGGNNENIDTDNYIYVKPLRSTANNDTLLTVAP